MTNEIQATIAALPTGVIPLIVTVGLWATQYGVRRKYPKLWKMCFSWVPEDTGPMARKVLQGLPSAVLGAAGMALYSGMDVRQAAWGAVYGACAPLLHHTLAAAPDRMISYHGALGEQASGQALDVGVASPTGGDTAETAAPEPPSGSPEP
jgi:hypothetical protein